MKEFSTKLLGNADENGLLRPYCRKKFDNEILLIINIKLKDNFSNCLFLTSARCKINNRLFHSTVYNRKGSINSFTVSYTVAADVRYGEIMEFLEHGKKITQLSKEYTCWI